MTIRHLMMAVAVVAAGCVALLNVARWGLAGDLSRLFFLFILTTAYPLHAAVRIRRAGGPTKIGGLKAGAITGAVIGLLLAVIGLGHFPRNALGVVVLAVFLVFVMAVVGAAWGWVIGLVVQHWMGRRVKARHDVQA